MASRLLVAFPEARYAGIDVAPEVGHLVRGRPDSCDVPIASTRGRTRVRPASGFDLVVVVDVLAPCAADARGAPLDDVARVARRPVAHYVLKDGFRSTGRSRTSTAWSLRQTVTRRRPCLVASTTRRARAARPGTPFPSDRLDRTAAASLLASTISMLAVRTRALISVVIPVKNGGADLARCLAGIAAQGSRRRSRWWSSTPGSTDGSPERARRAGAVVHEIPPEEFGHGRTRNLGVELARGDAVVFTSQDAVADDSGWLARLVAAARSGANVAGAYGRQLPHPDARPPERFFLDFMYGPARVSSGSIRMPSSPSRRRCSRTSTPRSRARSSSATRSATI